MIKKYKKQKNATKNNTKNKRKKTRGKKGWIAARKGEGKDSNYESKNGKDSNVESKNDNGEL